MYVQHAIISSVERFCLFWYNNQEPKLALNCLKGIQETRRVIGFNQQFTNKNQRKLTSLQDEFWTPIIEHES